MLRDTGCAFEPESEAIGLFRAAGCTVDVHGTVRFPTALVLEAIQTTAKRATLWDRNGEHPVVLDRRHLVRTRHDRDQDL